MTERGPLPLPLGVGRERYPAPGAVPLPGWTPWGLVALPPDPAGRRIGPRQTIWTGSPEWPFARVALCIEAGARARLVLSAPSLGTTLPAKILDVAGGMVEMVVPGRSTLQAAAINAGAGARAWVSSTWANEDAGRQGPVDEVNTIPGGATVDVAVPPQGALETWIQTSAAATWIIFDDVGGALPLAGPIATGPAVNNGQPIPIGPMSAGTVLRCTAPAGAALNASAHFRVQV